MSESPQETTTLADLLEELQAGQATTRGEAHAVESERELLGACLFGGADAVAEALEVGVSARDFSSLARLTTWEAVVRLVDRGDRVSALAVSEELLTTGKLQVVGGSQAITGLVGVRTATVRQAARSVVEDGAYRRLADLADAVRRRAVDRVGTAADVLAAAQEAFCALSRQTRSDHAADRAQIVRQVLQDSQSDRVQGLPTGWGSLDAMLGTGLLPGQVVICAARPAMGKSAFGHQWACQVADEGIPTAFFSLEMSPEELIAREIAGQSRAPKSTWRTREGAARAAGAAGKVAERPLQLHHVPGCTITDLAARLRRCVTRDGVGLAVVDYLGLVRATGAYAGHRTQEVGEVSRTFKALAGELRIPLVVLAQLNRGVESRQGANPGAARPGLADLRDSGEIEQDADVVCFLHRPEYYLREKTPPDLEGKAELIVAKQRNGPTGVCVMEFDGPTTRFVARPTDGREYR